MNRSVGLLCICLTLGLLYAGLRPFGPVANEVAWLKGRNGLHFGEYAVLLSSKPFDVWASDTDREWSFEMWLQPGMIQDTNTLVSFYSPANASEFSIHQLNSDLGIDTLPTGIVVRNIFQEHCPVFLTITSGTGGTKVYKNGILVASEQSTFPSKYLSGRLVIGNSPHSNDSWSGELYGFAMYRNELVPLEVVRRYEAWRGENRESSIVPSESSLALYTFDNQQGATVTNRVRGALGLYIPRYYTVLRQRMLEPVWKEINASPGYRRDVIVNIAGFIPYGFFLYSYFARMRHVQHSVVLAVTIGFAVSLTIEMLQAYLPTRDSSGSDVAANTLGTAIGILLYIVGGRILRSFVQWKGRSTQSA